VAVALLGLVLAALRAVGPAFAAPVVPFTPRFATTDNGTVSIFGNNLLTCPASDGRCPGAKSGTQRLNNNSFAMVNVDRDSTASTFNSSSAVVSGPTGSSVMWAGLYWGARVSAGPGGSPGPGGVGARRVMSLWPPNAAGYVPVSSAASFGPTNGDQAYQEFADVTALVQGAGPGTYWGANVVAGTGEDRYAGWALVVVYRAPDLPLRNLTVFDGFSDVGQGNPEQITISGFLAPAAPAAVEADLGMVAYEGDYATSGDQAQLNGTLLSTTPLSPSNNFFNGTNDTNGRSVASRNPADVNMLGFDIKNLGASGINNGDRSATINLNSTGDRYFPGVVTTAIKLFAPDFSTSSKSVVNLSGRTPALPGDEIEYILEYPNTGQDAATNVTVSDELPSGTTFVSASPSYGSCSPSGSTVRCDVGTIPVAGTWRATVRARVEPQASGTTLTNAALLDYTAQTLGQPFTYRVAPASIPVGAVADLSLTKTSTPDPGLAGGQVTSTLTVRNSGPSPATNTVVTDRLPPGVTLVSTTPACSAAAETLTCPLGTLPTGASRTVTVTVAIPSGSSANALVNVGSVTSDTAELDPDNNSAGSSVAVAKQADLHVTKVAAPTNVVPGQTTTYTVTVRNDGPSDASNVIATDAVPDFNLDLTSATAPGATCAVTVDVARCAIPTLSPGATLTMTVVGRVSPDAPAGMSIANTATAASDTGDPDPADNEVSSSVTTTAPQADLATTKTASNAVAGGQVTYTVTVRNNGPSSAAQVSLADALPAGLIPVSAESSRGTCSLAATVTCALGSLPGPQAGGATTEAVVTIVADLPPDFAAGTMRNTATAATSTTDPVAGNNAATVATGVTAQADLSLSKVADPLQPAAGSNVTFTLTVSNAGPSTARAVDLVDTLPPGLTLVSVDPSTCAGTTTLTCPIGELAPRASATVTVVMGIPADFDLQTGAVNTARATTPTADPVPGNNTATVTLTTRAISDVAVLKFDDGGPPGTPPRTMAAGETVTYSVAALNFGPSDATTAQVVDTLPPGLTFVSSVPQCAFSPPNRVVCNLPTVPTGFAAVFPVTVRVDPNLADGALLTNSAQITLTDPNRVDPVSANNIAAITNPVETRADVSVAKRTYSLDLPSGGFTVPSAAPAGTPSGYFIDVRNDGPSPARNVVLLDTSTMTDFFLNQVRLVKPGGEVVDLTASCSFSSGQLQCPLGDLPVFAAADPSWTIQVDGVTLSNATAGSYQNTASLSSATRDADEADNSASAPITVTAPVATLTIAKTSVDSSDVDGDGDPDFVPGGSFTYQLTIANVLDLSREGAADADGVVVTDTLPPGFTATSAIASQGSCDLTQGASVTCDLGTVLGPGRVPEPPAAVITISGTIAPSARGQANNSATVTSPISAPATANHGQDLVAVGDVAITKIPDDPQVAAGSPAGFSLVVTNAGPSDAVDVEVGDVLPAGITFDAALSGPSCTIADTPIGPFVSCPIGTLGVGETRTVRVAGQVSPSQPAGELVNRAAATSPITGEYDFSNNLSEVPITVVQSADLVLDKIADSGTVVVGSQAGYTLTVTNHGPSDATGVQVSDDVPAGLTVVSVPPGCSVTGTAIVCTAPTLEVGASATYRIALALPVGLEPGQVTNTAVVSSPTADPDPTTNTASATVTALVVADTAITKSVLTPNPVAGQPLRFALDVVNNGPQDAPGLVFSDSLAPGLTLVSAQVQGGPACELTRPEDVDVVTCEVGAVPVGGTARAVITVQPDPAMTRIDNGASVGSAALDEVSTNNYAVVTVPLQTPTPTPTPTPSTSPSPNQTASSGPAGTPAVVAAEPPAGPGGSEGASLPGTGVAVAAILAAAVALLLAGQSLRAVARRGRAAQPK